MVNKPNIKSVTCYRISLFLISTLFLDTSLCLAKSVAYIQIPLAISIYEAKAVIVGKVELVKTTEKDQWDTFQLCKVSVQEVLKGKIIQKYITIPSVNNSLEVNKNYIFIL